VLSSPIGFCNLSPDSSIPFLGYVFEGPLSKTGQTPSSLDGKTSAFPGIFGLDNFVVYLYVFIWIKSVGPRERVHHG